MAKSIAPPPPLSILVSYHFGPVASSSITPTSMETYNRRVRAFYTGTKSGSRFQ